MDSYLHAFVLANGYSNDYRRVLLVPLQSPLFYRNGHHHFFSSSNTTIGEIYLSQSFQYANDFHRAMQVDLWIYNMISTIGPQTVWSYFNFVTHFYELSYVEGNIEHDLQMGMRNHSNAPTNFYFMNQNANFLGNLPNHYEEYSFYLGNFYLSNSPTWILQSNMYEHHVEISLGITNNPTAAIDFNWQSIQNPNYAYSLVSSGQMNPYIALDSSITMNEHNFVSRPEIHGGGYSRTHFISSLPPSNYETRSRMLAEVSATLDYLLTDDTLRIEGVILTEEEDEVSNMGLSEDRVMMHIGHENFEFVEEETIDNKEACCICQVRMDIS
ncbi:hypothetical protein RIF29_33892 [Crotalaria pallida]|uniref:Uncharacterized protein n=1 Tax=Crotalaria pallida TaxID=3830 RepID=A0AAN9EAI8_CROPI